MIFVSANINYFVVNTALNIAALNLHEMKNKKLFLLSLCLFCGLLFNGTTSFAQEMDKILYEGKFAPEFQVKDIEGNSHSITQYKGKKILLSFYRNAGCPVCNYRFHELEDSSRFFKENNIMLLSVYESSVENLKLLLDTNQYYQKLVADPEGILYAQYGVEENKGKISKGILHGALQKSTKGKKKFATKIKQDGKPNRIAADFLIDENGNILIAYYGKYLGDRLPISVLKNKLK